MLSYVRTAQNSEKHDGVKKEFRTGSGGRSKWCLIRFTTWTLTEAEGPDRNAGINTKHIVTIVDRQKGKNEIYKT